MVKIAYNPLTNFIYQSKPQIQDGIAVNAIWPRTAIMTAAMVMLGGGQEIVSQCRTPDIMADAAYVILTRDSKTYTGNSAQKHIIN